MRVGKGEGVSWKSGLVALVAVVLPLSLAGFALAQGAARSQKPANHEATKVGAPSRAEAQTAETTGAASGKRGKAASGKAGQSKRKGWEGLEDRGSVLRPGQVLKANQYLSSANDKFFLGMQPDGNSVLYGPGQRVLWATHTQGSPGARLEMQRDGNLVLYHGRRALWDSKTERNLGARLEIRNDSNLVVYSRDNRVLWSRYMLVSVLPSGQRLGPGHSVRSKNGLYRLVQHWNGNLVLHGPGGRALWATHTQGKPGARFEMQRDGNGVLYRGRRALWSSKTEGNPGAFLMVQDDGNLVIYSGTRAVWSTNTHRR